MIWFSGIYTREYGVRQGPYSRLIPGHGGSDS
jgi:hypothetical protein